jgi:hypothetical protein
MRRRIVLLACGVVLVAPLTFILFEELVVLRLSEVVEGTRPLAAVPIDALTPGQAVTVEFTVPSGGAWERMRKSFVKAIWICTP